MLVIVEKIRHTTAILRKKCGSISRMHANVSTLFKQLLQTLKNNDSTTNSAALIYSFRVSFVTINNFCVITNAIEDVGGNNHFFAAIVSAALLPSLALYF